MLSNDFLHNKEETKTCIYILYSTVQYTILLSDPNLFSFMINFHKDKTIS